MIQVGSVLIAKDECKMVRNLRNSSGNALIIGKEYVIHAFDDGLYFVVKSEIDADHFFGTDPNDESYWGIYFDLKEKK